MEQFKDRHDAGQKLAQALEFIQAKDDVLVLAIPRGGVVVGCEVATALKAPIDVILVRKIGVPGNPELAMGAISGDGTVYLDQDLISQLRIPLSYVEEEQQRQKEEIARRLAMYRSNCPPLEIEDRCIVLVDDGIATGSTVEVALHSLRKHKLRELILAIPVAPPASFARLARLVDRAVCLRSPELFWAVGSFYESFDQTTDDEVVALLSQAREAFP